MPAGTTGDIHVVTVPTTPDGIYEGRMSMTLTATLTGATASGTALPRASPGWRQCRNRRHQQAACRWRWKYSRLRRPGWVSIKNSNGTSDTTDSPQANGQLSITGDNSATYSITLVAPPMAP